MMTSSNGIDWEVVVNSPSIALQDIVWSPELSLLVVVATSSTNTTPAIYTSSDAITWTSRTTRLIMSPFHKPHYRFPLIN